MDIVIILLSFYSLFTTLYIIYLNTCFCCNVKKCACFLAGFIHGCVKKIVGIFNSNKYSEPLMEHSSN